MAQYSLAGILALAALQLGLMLIGRLVSLIATGRIFTDVALKRVNAVITCLAAATAIPTLVMIHLLFIAGLGGPGMLLGLGAMLLGGSALALLLV